MSGLTEKNIEEVLSKIRPYLQKDGGDVELAGIREGGIVEVRLLGSCKDCPLSPMTLRAGIERVLLKKIPEIKRIESVK
ncbi:MAG TPA: NifU family protein [Ignavibacteria bacterium]|nr:NifU family protein [Ignavibacteria bacterium]HQY51088.1 NifU family protein [Ignavibacteria bacterium]HRB00475.1 NifU family protein [Ignavibacteria bacterium]